MRSVLTNDAATDAYLEWLGKQTRARWLVREIPNVYDVEGESDLGKHSHPDDTDLLQHRGYQCEACRGYWAALEPVGADQPEELPCLATEGCEGPVVGLYPTDEPVPDWIPVIIQGGKT